MASSPSLEGLNPARKVEEIRRLYLLESDKLPALRRFERILKQKNAEFYRRADNTLGVTWNTLEADVEGFIALLAKILETSNVSGPEYRSQHLNAMYAKLVARSPLFKNLTLTFSSRLESTLEHVLKVSRLADDPSGEINPQYHRTIQRLETILHDIGKYFIAQLDQSDGATFKLVDDFTQDHSFIGAHILDELLFRASQSSALNDHPQPGVSELFSSLNLATPEGRRIFTAPVALHHAPELHAKNIVDTPELAAIMMSPFYKDRAEAIEQGDEAELENLNQQLLTSLHHFILLTMADVGAGGNPQFIVENARAARLLIDHMVEIEGFEECNTLYRVLAGSLGRTLYEMGMCLEYSLAGNELMRAKKGQAINDNIDAILHAEKQLESMMGESEESAATITQLRKTIGAGIVQLMSVIRKKLNSAGERDENHNDHRFMSQLLNSIYEKVQSSCSEIGLIVWQWLEENAIVTLMLIQMPDEDDAQPPPIPG